jgi:hypothetical protein
MDHEPQWDELAEEMEDLLNDDQKTADSDDELKADANPVSMGPMMASISEVTLNNLYLGDLQQQTDDIRI